MVRHAALWDSIRKYNINANLVRAIEQLYDKANCSSDEQQHERMVQNNSWSKTKMPSLNHSFQHLFRTNYALEEYDRTVSIGSRNITNLRFADDIDALAEEEQELYALVESLDKTCIRYQMEISAEKTEWMTNSANCIQVEIKVK